MAFFNDKNEIIHLRNQDFNDKKYTSQTPAIIEVLKSFIKKSQKSGTK